ncbi:hypothetical protein CYLTODRAFT_495306 [Cylindrobasidium torrendii FP15055 ss-10]|uniref:Uncharacterized protein n=1 Tax=Cylindrobasidium torrendii FP15055 ss-10 TaxID=1314674 RepID=A0A0D7ASJ4_9AGAR|nr:hypothetical protein CYLTODRAFT_495306 [Cylindrobasidium torrendii FP15055 ss-10]
MPASPKSSAPLPKHLRGLAVWETAIPDFDDYFEPCIFESGLIKHTITFLKNGFAKQMNSGQSVNVSTKKFVNKVKASAVLSTIAHTENLSVRAINCYATDKWLAQAFRRLDGLNDVENGKDTELTAENVTLMAAFFWTLSPDSSPASDSSERLKCAMDLLNAERGSRGYSPMECEGYKRPKGTGLRKLRKAGASQAEVYEYLTGNEFSATDSFTPTHSRVSYPRWAYTEIHEARRRSERLSVPISAREPVGILIPGSQQYKDHIRIVAENAKAKAEYTLKQEGMWVDPPYVQKQNEKKERKAKAKENRKRDAEIEREKEECKRERRRRVKKTLEIDPLDRTASLEPRDKDVRHANHEFGALYCACNECCDRRAAAKGTSTSVATRVELFSPSAQSVEFTADISTRSSQKRKNEGVDPPRKKTKISAVEVREPVVAETSEDTVNKQERKKLKKAQRRAQQGVDVENPSAAAEFTSSKTTEIGDEEHVSGADVLDMSPPSTPQRRNSSIQASLTPPSFMTIPVSSPAVPAASRLPLSRMGGSPTRIIRPLPKRIIRARPEPSTPTRSKAASTDNVRPPKSSLQAVSCLAIQICPVRINSLSTQTQRQTQSSTVTSKRRMENTAGMQRGRSKTLAPLKRFKKRPSLRTKKQRSSTSKGFRIKGRSPGALLSSGGARAMRKRLEAISKQSRYDLPHAVHRRLDIAHDNLLKNSMISRLLAKSLRSQPSSPTIPESEHQRPRTREERQKLMHELTAGKAPRRVASTSTRPPRIPPHGGQTRPRLDAGSDAEVEIEQSQSTADGVAPPISEPPREMNERNQARLDQLLDELEGITGKRWVPPSTEPKLFPRAELEKRIEMLEAKKKYLTMELSNTIRDLSSWSVELTLQKDEDWEDFEKIPEDEWPGSSPARRKQKKGPFSPSHLNNSCLPESEASSQASSTSSASMAEAIRSPTIVAWSRPARLQSSSSRSPGMKSRSRMT